MFDASIVNLDVVKINQLEQGSHLRFGCNIQVGINNNSKKNEVFGQQYADQVLVFIPVAILDDRDGEDSTSASNV